MVDMKTNRLHHLFDALRESLRPEEVGDLELGSRADATCEGQRCKKKKRNRRRSKLSKLKYFFLRDSDGAHDDAELYELHDSAWLAPDPLANQQHDPFELSDEQWVDPQLLSTA